MARYAVNIFDRNLTLWVWTTGKIKKTQHEKETNLGMDIGELFSKRNSDVAPIIVEWPTFLLANQINQPAYMPLSKVTDGDSVYVIGHCSPGSSTISSSQGKTSDGKDPEEINYKVLIDRLLSLGLPNFVKVKLKLFGCNTGSSSRSFAWNVKNHIQGFSWRVFGYTRTLHGNKSDTGQKTAKKKFFESTTPTASSVRKEF